MVSQDDYSTERDLGKMIDIGRRRIRVAIAKE